MYVMNMAFMLLEAFAAASEASASSSFTAAAWHGRVAAAESTLVGLASRSALLVGRHQASDE